MFRRKVKIEPSGFQLDHSSKMITIGSCFSDTIGEKLNETRFDIMLNPFGTIFHPIALANSIERFSPHQILERDNYFFHWQTGGKHHSTTESELKEQMLTLRDSFEERLKEVDVIMVTFGTAWGYEMKSSGEIVANCHKMPQDLFEKKLYSSSDILSAWKPLVEAYPQIRWVFTVSPVRHWKDGVRENNLSKGILHQVIHELLVLENASYFPAYEIMLDELRDYRFYAKDYLHPSDEAVDYIWGRFKETYFNERTANLVTKIEGVNNSRAHKLMYPNSEEALNFKRALDRQEEEIQKALNEFRA